MFVLSMTGSVFMIVNLYYKLNIDAITVLIENGSQNISQIPFPAITFFGGYPKPEFIQITDLQ